MQLNAPADNPMNEWAERYAFNSRLFVREVLGAEPDTWQDAVLLDYDRKSIVLALSAMGVNVAETLQGLTIEDEKRGISIRSGHGVGKTALLAWIIVHHVLFRFPQKTAVTAATKDQLFDALVPEVKGWIENLPPTVRQMLIVQTESLSLKHSPDKSFVTFKVSRPENPEALAGIHSKHVLLIGDEASGIHEKIFEAASGSMSDEQALTILAGNPVRSSGLFHETHTTLSGWTRYHVSCLTAKRVSKRFPIEMAERYGIDSNQYRVRVLGEFPKASDDTIIPFELVELAKTRDVDPIEGTRPVWGLDVARFGEDASALAKRRKNVLLGGVREWRGKSTMEIAGIVKAEYDATPVEDQPDEIIVDSIGIGAGVVDRLAELGLPAFGLNVSESPALKELYADMRTELYFRGKAWFEMRNCSIGTSNDAAAKQLVAVKFKYESSGKLRAQPKKEFKKDNPRMGSPDASDAVILTFARDAGIALGGSSAFPKTSWKKSLKRNIKGIV